MNLVIYSSVEKFQSTVLDLQRAAPIPDSLITPLTYDRMFYLRDAIGRESSITLSFITSYEALTVVLRVRFDDMPGLKKVLRNEFSIQNRVTGKDVDRNILWESFFRPGLWFGMDMIFQAVIDEGSGSPNEDTRQIAKGPKIQQQIAREMTQIGPLLWMTLISTKQWGSRSLAHSHRRQISQYKHNRTLMTQVLVSNQSWRIPTMASVGRLQQTLPPMRPLILKQSMSNTCQYMTRTIHHQMW